VGGVGGVSGVGSVLGLQAECESSLSEGQPGVYESAVHPFDSVLYGRTVSYVMSTLWLGDTLGNTLGDALGDTLGDTLKTSKP
jgi:hypothetical protein